MLWVSEVEGDNCLGKDVEGKVGQTRWQEVGEQVVNEDHPGQLGCEGRCIGIA